MTRIEKEKQREEDDHEIQQISIQEMKQFVKEMRPSGKINDIHAIRLFLLGIISKLEDIIK